MELLTERQIREKQYYDQYAVQHSINDSIDLAPVDGPLLKNERRPWNSYWRTYEVAIDYSKSKKNYSSEPKLLDFGCGAGDNSIRFSRAGYHITGFDISENNIQSCIQLFSKKNIPANFIVSVAEKLPFADETFDVVAGIDILHHVDIPSSINEVKRVLKKDGIAVFREPLEATLFDTIRNTKPILKLFPNTMSLEAHITEDERKLNKTDLKVLKEIFPDITIERSLVMARFDRFLRKPTDPKPSLLEKIDFLLSKFIPFYSLLGGAAVITLRKN
jgi:2-polyprenyl-3-methyl-5-hydroxy-6-metoxy-1,4-benzoquinol methylase